MTSSFLGDPANTQSGRRPAPTDLDSKLRICTGSDCRKHNKRLEKIAAQIEDTCDVRAVKCQEIYRGRLLVLEHGENVEQGGPQESPLLAVHTRDASLK